MAVTANAHATMTLENGFKNPPLETRPGAFWPWLNANVDRDRIRYELQQMKEKGMSGAEIWDVQAMRNPDQVPAGPEFLSPESVANIKFALAEAKKLGLRMGMITSSGWNAGGTWVEPDWASKLLISSSVTTTGPVTFSQEVPFPKPPDHCPLGPDGKPKFYLDVALLAVPANKDNHITSTTEVIDLTGKLTADGKLTWEVPEGSWNILRFVCTNTGQELIVPSPKSKGLFIDFLDPDATRRHMQTIMDRLEITPENAADSGLHYMEVDSMELHPGNPWTDKFPDWFKKLRGYDLRKYLPALAGYTIGDKAASDSLLYDYRNAISDLLIHSHYETGSEFLAKYGMEFVGEAGGPGPPIWDTCPVDALKALGNMHIPRGEFWIQHRNMFLIKEVASASHIYGKQIVDAEAFTTWRRWEDSPFILKTVADRAFAEGLNHITIHTFAHSPEAAGLPGRAYHAGIDINPNTTWWSFARPFLDYLARCSFMLRQGVPVSDVLWFYGDQAPNFFPLFHDVPEKPRLPGLGRGYDYDVINSDIILNRLSVKDGRFVLPEGTSYRVLAFPDEAAMPVEVLKKLEDLVKQGGIIVGNPPKQAPALHDREAQDRQLKEISSRLWDSVTSGSSSPYGGGRVYRGLKLDDVLAAEGVEPDFQVISAGDELKLDYIHRQAEGRDIYFVRNETLEPVNATLQFRVSGKFPTLWDAATGEVQPPVGADADTTSQALVSYKNVGDRTEAELKLPPGGAVFIVFGDTHIGTSAPIDQTTGTQHMLVPADGWTVMFPPDNGAPTSVTLETLQSLTKHQDPGVRHFSGVADYKGTFEIPSEMISSGTRTMLDLGDVRDIAEVLVNSKSAGVTWKPPYQVDVTGLLQPGQNEIRVQVANLWHNRLVGDTKLPPDERVTKTNLPLQPKEKADLLDSGLLGPVVLTTMPVSTNPTAIHSPQGH